MFSENFQKVDKELLKTNKITLASGVAHKTVNNFLFCLKEK